MDNRRDFLKKAFFGVGALSMGAGLKAFAGNEDHATKKTFSLFRKTHDRIEDIYEIRPDYERMDQKNTIFCRSGWDKRRADVLKSFGAKSEKILPNPLRGQAGYSDPDYALSKAAGGGETAGTGFSKVGQRNGGPLNNWENHTQHFVAKEQYAFASPEEASAYVKKAALFLGAHDAGIAPFDERWIYKKWYDVSPFMRQEGEYIHEDAKFPFQPKSVIVTAHEMDYDAILAPGYLNDAAVMKGYSEMTEVTHKIALFLNKLGYKAIPTGNDVGLNIPTAIQAGLGELSRMGTLIHERLGSRFRIAKVYTDLELMPDKPITFGVQEFCKKCKKCAENCPSKSISLETEPTWDPKTNSISSHQGVKKWYQNNETCHDYWEKQGVGCGICIAVCPYNKLETWIHDVSKVAVSIPVGRDIARQLDDAFGYGEISEESAKEFWKK